MKTLPRLLAAALATTALLSDCGGGGGETCSSSAATANASGTWVWDYGNVVITQNGSDISGYIFITSSVCCSISNNPKCHFTGTVAGNCVTATGPNGTFSVSAAVNGDRMSGSYSSTDAFCDGAQSGSFSAGRE